MGGAALLLVLLDVCLLVLVRAGRADIATGVALAGGLLGQAALGYRGRDDLSAAAWHVAVGVGVFGLAVLHAARAFPGVGRQAGEG